MSYTDLLAGWCARCRLRSLVKGLERRRRGRGAGGLGATHLGFRLQFGLADELLSARRYITTGTMAARTGLAKSLVRMGAGGGVAPRRVSVFRPLQSPPLVRRVMPFQQQYPHTRPRQLHLQQIIGSRRSFSLSALVSRSKRPYPESQVGKAAPLDNSQKAFILQDLFVRGQISKEEWRAAVLTEVDGLPRESGQERELESNLEERILRLRDWFGGPLPRVFLEPEESVVHESIWGDKGTEIEETIQADEEGLGLDGEEADDEATGLLRADEGADAINFDLGGEQRTGDVAWQTAYSDPPPQKQEEYDAQRRQDEEDPIQRTHPLTLVNRFTTSPSTLEMPRSAFIDPVTALLSPVSNTHLSDAAHRVFGGFGLPYSTSTPARGKTMQQKPIALDAYQTQMSPIEGDMFISTLMPGMYAGIMSMLVETRKRLGTAWAEDLVKKAESGELRILDAGAGGAGVLAVREMLRAEWERMHEEGRGDESPMALAEVDGKLGGGVVHAPTGKATVLTGSEMLKKRASQLLDNTTFIPRLPDYVHTESAKQKGKFDLVLGVHGLWPLKEDYLRKTHVQNLWGLTSSEGGVLLLLEKGVARGFETIAGAREMLLANHISSPDSPTRQREIDEPVPEEEEKEQEGVGESRSQSLLASSTHQPKETAMIIAPCTNHSACPMYSPKGLLKGRREICAFAQRYHRPAFLQNIFGTKGKNHEDVEFSYLSVLRGRDLRPSLAAGEDVQAHAEAITAQAFAGYESSSDNNNLPPFFTLPRAILPPLKRTGHVIFDLCTPAARLERWTLPRSFSKPAYRDARKAAWGDLWPLGAKTRVPRKVTAVKKRPGQNGEPERPREFRDGEKRGRSGKLKYSRGSNANDGHADSPVLILRPRREVGAAAAGSAGSGNSAETEFEHGRVRGRKEKGIRDKRDKTGMGNGRRKNSFED